ncbi:MAG: hypothetical protein COV07_00670 [Candidatus Vogelbacteria bacterium CG10_big_fil_rev_8_21_14_0_10_45_14]|uniref:DHHA1 domain-containing protein n=1 Tax=Candidatus Vogelbacteria bacterium CG10_big_fil_rev_8_21_14_0_10_45_14 TaxID=1975042 RepID=A0A2H0RKU8_9BACT|nr:MAG: hypothetical protein COV07_00670 [Candidatus Vogelbacteria bacterium CG10_big_fil_rev_8_21_14_0_10_45_14]
MRPIIFYHKDCSDGFGAAYSAWKKFGNNADYRALSNGEDTPIAELVGREAYFLDISPKTDLAKEASEKAGKLIIIDHHKSNSEAFEYSEGGLYDLGHSGAVLSWQYFNQNTPLPRLFKYIEDMDLWKLELDDTKFVSLALSMVPKEFEAWDKYVSYLETDEGFKSEVEKGASLLAFAHREIEAMAKDAEEVLFEGHKVLAVNAPTMFATPLGHLLASRRPPFSIIWHKRNGQYKVSMRATGDVDLSKIAAKYGGGGHPGASAFVVSQENWVQFIKQLYG